ncbi:LytTR family DNA-binding domain-containing protein [Mangrovivirga sp. M17]|uniref:LytTR family DNA-binding domain-containing protein n=1 Tax=Mangrovivirga halotolerans TaxID=2993936 RepID=A0ABT3RMJ5_9BACT|nr:LytTR family DNA-binding domain-containing protein [Mangrovivirga halotolerans]MCX2742801.1 LytTR family DNA-binding domain-containing protein [Mangrovivirga halotolerans]
MNVLIIEDEKPAAKRLESIINQLRPDFKILAKIESVKDAVEYLKNNPSPDIIFLDIQISDGISFEIFDHVEVKVPIIFTTAYNEYALKAFDLNSVDYLLKPIDDEDVDKALNKFDDLKNSFAPGDQIQQLTDTMKSLTKNFKNRFLIKTGEHYKSVPVNQINYFFSRQKATFCNTVDGKNLLIDHSLDKLESLLDPESFYRVNRKYIIGFSAIRDIIAYSNSRLKILTENQPDEDIIVARDKVNEFKSKLDS